MLIFKKIKLSANAKESHEMKEKKNENMKE